MEKFIKNKFKNKKAGFTSLIDLSKHQVSAKIDYFLQKTTSAIMCNAAMRECKYTIHHEILNGVNKPPV